MRIQIQVSELGPVPVIHCIEDIRSMRGECRPRLVRGDDNQYYVVKRADGPLGRRALLNELVGHVLMRRMGVDTPAVALAEFDGDPELHFASRLPGAPEDVAIYDFLPDAMLTMVANRDAFFGALVFDQWVSNADGRQSIFFRRPAELPCGGGDAIWHAQLIDNNQAFQGSAWRLCDSPLHGIYGQTAAYGDDVSLSQFESWIARAMEIDHESVVEALRTMPGSWLEGQEREFSDLLFRLFLRRDRLPGLVQRCVELLRQ